MLRIDVPTANCYGGYLRPATRRTAAIALTALLAIAAVVPARAAVSAQCLIAGPYPDRAAAATATARARGSGLMVRVAPRSALRTVYWVELNHFRNAAVAKRAVRHLHALGWRDMQVLRGGAGSVPRISLGAFDDLGHALRRAERARLLGFEPVVRTVYRKVRRWYVQAPLSASAAALAETTDMAPRRAACAAPAPAAGD